MKKLLLLRHAKSSWDNPALTDHERPLNKRGLGDAPHVGELLAAEDLLPDIILSSTAERARQTTEIVIETSGYQGAVRYLDELYHAAPAAYYGLLHNLPTDVEAVMCVAHNPGLEALIEQLTDNYTRMPTAALAYLKLNMTEWTNWKSALPAELIHIWRPKETF